MIFGIFYVIEVTISDCISALPAVPLWCSENKSMHNLKCQLFQVSSLLGYWLTLLLTARVPLPSCALAIECPHGMVYKECGSMCKVSCRDLGNDACQEQCVQGCQCPDGMVGGLYSAGSWRGGTMDWLVVMIGDVLGKVFMLSKQQLHTSHKQYTLQKKFVGNPVFIEE